MDIKKLTDSKSARQFVRYLITGGTAFVAEYAMYQVLYRFLGVDYAVSSVIVYSALFVITFVATRRWTFESRGNAKRQLLLYFLLFAFNVFVGNYLMMRAFVGMGMSKDIAPFFKTAIITCWNFILYKFVIYKD